MKPISISLSPNTEKDDVWLAFKLLFQPWKWKKHTENGSLYVLEKEFKKYLSTRFAFSFNSGRSALIAILSSLELDRDDEVLLQVFTCNAAINPIIWSGLKPVYVDCDEETFNIDLEDLKRKITPKARAIMVQHTFGLPANMDEILEICQKNNLILIEDCAHSLGANYKSKEVGTFGKVAFFSFGRDKIISSVYGGMAVTNDPLLGKKLKQVQDKFSYPSYYWIFQQLLHPILMNWLILPTYSFLGKYLLVLFQQLNILSKAVHQKEKKGLKPNYFPRRLPNALAILALNQLKKIEKFNNHRKKIADFYFQKLSNTKYKIPARIASQSDTGGLDTKYKEGNIFLRFPLKYEKAHEIIKKAWNNNLLMGDWYTSPIVPNDTDLEKMNYQSGSCPKAEKLAKETLNLPTHINISKKDAQKIINFLKNYV